MASTATLGILNMLYTHTRVGHFGAWCNAATTVERGKSDGKSETCESTTTAKPSGTTVVSARCHARHHDVLRVKNETHNTSVS